MSRTITMIVREGNHTTTVTDVLESTGTWMAQAYLFHNFLLAQGFRLDAEEVGADVRAYLKAQVTEEESW